jgi:hypothetical protein
VVEELSPSSWYCLQFWSSLVRFTDPSCFPAFALDVVVAAAAAFLQLCRVEAEADLVLLDLGGFARWLKDEVVKLSL